MLCVLRLSKTSNFWVFSQHIMGYDPAKKSWVMAYRRLMGYPPYPNSGRAKKYGVSGIMGYQDLWVKGTSTVYVSLLAFRACRALTRARSAWTSRWKVYCAAICHVAAIRLEPRE